MIKMLFTLIAVFGLVVMFWPDIYNNANPRGQELLNKIGAATGIDKNPAHQAYSMGENTRSDQYHSTVITLDKKDRNTLKLTTDNSIALNLRCEHQKGVTAYAVIDQPFSDPQFFYQVSLPTDVNIDMAYSYLSWNDLSAVYQYGSLNLSFKNQSGKTEVIRYTMDSKAYGFLKSCANN